MQKDIRKAVGPDLGPTQIHGAEVLALIWIPWIEIKAEVPSFESVPRSGQVAELEG